MTKPPPTSYESCQTWVCKQRGAAAQRRISRELAGAHPTGRCRAIESFFRE